MLGLLLFLAQAAAAPDRPKEVLAIIDQARSLPPRFSADLMLRLAASRLVTEATWRRELVEEAFTTGGHGRDAISLQTAAVNAMLALDPPRALALFRDIPPPDPPVLTCQDVTVPDLSPYYQTAGRVFQSAFTAPQRTAEDDVRFLQQIIASVHSPSQVVPALKMMPDAGARMTSPQRQQLAGAFAAVLDRVAGGDREFSASERVLVPSALPEMHDSQMFVPALRRYIVRHLSGARCSDSIPAEGLPESARQFNSLIARLAATTAQLLPITAAEVGPLKNEGIYRKQTSEGDPDSQDERILSLYATLKAAVSRP